MKNVEGLWMPIEILKVKELSLTAKVFLSMIICLDNENGCTATNQYLAEISGCSITQLSTMINLFEKLNFLKIKDGKSYKRVITFNKDCNEETLRKLKGNLTETERLTLRKLKTDNIYNIYNIINNIYLEKEKKKKEKDDAVNQNVNGEKDNTIQQSCNNNIINTNKKEKMKIASYPELKSAIKEDYLYKIASIYKLNKNTISAILDAFVNINKDKKSNEFKFCQHFENWLKTDKGQQAINSTRMTSNNTNNYQQD